MDKRGGPGSGFLHQRVRAGSRLEISAPRGAFLLAPGATPVVLISAGVGVTPRLAMLDGAAATDAAASQPFGGCTQPAIVRTIRFPRRADELLVALQAFHRCVIYSRPAAGDRLGQDFDPPGHVSLELLQELEVPRDADLYLCGPPLFLKQLQDGLAAWGVPWPRIHTELFGSASSLAPGISGPAPTPPHLPAGTPGIGPPVTFLFGSLLELAEACDVPVRWSCRSGVCHNCESGLIAGEVAYAPVPLDPPAEGNAIICCAMPRTAVELDL